MGGYFPGVTLVPYRGRVEALAQRVLVDAHHDAHLFSSLDSPYFPPVIGFNEVQSALLLARQPRLARRTKDYDAFVHVLRVRGTPTEDGIIGYDHSAHRPVVYHGTLDGLALRLFSVFDKRPRLRRVVVTREMPPTVNLFTLPPEGRA